VDVLSGQTSQFAQGMYQVRIAYITESKEGRFKGAYGGRDRSAAKDRRLLGLFPFQYVLLHLQALTEFSENLTELGLFPML
jgi:hypothetical protein